MKKVIIALDYSPSSQVVAETGYTLAKTLGAEAVLVHVISDAAYYSMPYSPIMGYEGFLADSSLLLAEQLKTEAGKYLAASVKHLEGEKISTAVLEGDVADAILDYANESRADLLVAGSHSHGGLYKLFVGGVAARLLQHSKIPMLIVPNKEEKSGASKKA